MRKMRRYAQQMSDDEARELISDCEYGVMSVVGDEGYPYGVPVNHVYFRGNIYFHGALEGHKVDAIGDGAKVSFTAVKKCSVNPQKLSTAYESVIAFGYAQIVKDDKEKKDALLALIEKFAVDYMQAGLSEIEREWNRTNIFKITIEHITAKFHK